MRQIQMLAMFLLISFKAVTLSAQSLDIDAISRSQSIYNNGIFKELKDSLPVIINDNYISWGNKEYHVMALVQSTKRRDKYRIYYMEPSKSHEVFDFELKVAEYSLGQLVIELGPGAKYFIYVN